MKNLAFPLVAFFAVASLAASAALAAESASASSDELAAALKPYLRKTLLQKFPTLGKELPIHVYFVEETTGSQPAEVIIYVKNKAWERVGQEDDLSILKDYIAKRFIVLTLDFGNDPNAVSPAVDGDLHEVYREAFGYQRPSVLRAIKLDPKGVRCFFLPEGYRVATDLTYWEIDKHGVHGTLEYVLKTYNSEIVPKMQKKDANSPSAKPATRPSDMVGPDGKPLDYRIQMDIVYPSQPKRKLPVFVYSETQIPRDTHHRYLFQLRGYVYVMMGHCFNPIEHYWHVGPFTLDHWNGLACYTAGIRYLNKYADQYGMDTNHIGMMGISKGQYAVTRLSDPNHALTKEAHTFNEIEGLGQFPEGTYGPQPWQGYSSRIHCGWQGMGAGLWCGRYVTPDYVPNILACGDNDRDVITKEGTPLFLQALEKLDVNHVYLPMEGLGHSISVGFDKRMGVDRYQLVNDFFDRYLKPEAKLPPVVLIVAPRDGAEAVKPADPIWVQFAPVIDEKTILTGKAVTVTKVDRAQEVKGAWKASHGGTKFTFTPDQPLAKGAQYEIYVSKAVKDKAGTSLAAEKKTRFTMAE